MKAGEALLEAAKKQAEGEVAVHIANIKGIGPRGRAGP